jgi:hypothetical protein
MSYKLAATAAGLFITSPHFAFAVPACPRSLQSFTGTAITQKHDEINHSGVAHSLHSIYSKLSS